MPAVLLALCKCKKECILGRQFRFSFSLMRLRFESELENDSFSFEQVRIGRHARLCYIYFLSTKIGASSFTDC